jgi:hypothetical protein
LWNFFNEIVAHVQVLKASQIEEALIIQVIQKIRAQRNMTQASQFFEVVFSNNPELIGDDQKLFELQKGNTFDKCEGHI